MVKSDREALCAVPLFTSLPATTLARIADVAVFRCYEAGQMVALEGEPCRTAFFIAAGQVRVYRLSPGGREQVLVRLGPGQLFNTVPIFLPDGVNHATVETLTAVELYAIPGDDLRRIVVDHPPLALAMLRDFAARLDHLTNLVEDLGLRTVRGRLARFLLEQADAGALAQRWTQDEMAAYLGTVRDMIGRTLRAFVDAGLIGLERQQIVLLDREGLEAEID